MTVYGASSLSPSAFEAGIASAAAASPTDPVLISIWLSGGMDSLELLAPIEDQVYRAMRPGLKNGWSQEQGGWVVNSVGFAAPDERYTLAIMTSLGNAGGYEDGSATDTKVAELLFAGR